MTTTLSFADQIGEWASQSEARIAAVRRRAIEMVAEEMIRTKPRGGRMPVDTSNMSRSLLASTQGMPKTAEGPFTGDNVGLVTATLGPQTPIWLGLQAEYSRRQNYGFVGADALGRVYNQPGNYFVEGAIAEWGNIVAKAAKELQNSVESR